MTRRAWLLVVAVIVVAVGVVAGVAIASSGSGQPSPPAAKGPRSTSSSAPPAPLASLCPAVPTKVVAATLHVPVARAVSASTQFERGCRWLDRAGHEVLRIATDSQVDMLLLHTLGNNGATKVGHLGGQAVFAPRPPRLAISVRQTGVLIQLAPAGYHPLLPHGTTNPARIPRTSALAPLSRLAKAVTRYLTR